MHDNNNHIGITGTLITLFFNALAYIDRGMVTFVIGVVVGLLTIVYYVVKIYNEFLNVKKNKKWKK